ncbi:hypothetical protein [Bradyrhizobium sp. BR 10261]|uniref:hypothetical protein n=1 Tax=Bradyrhizobium sp. BR 10261 TaxID=2749992 RepID=UPI001C650AEF|nr:hypothetical protein [Bradyrhizobium sp. BR 10261]MBW7967141.1 hypothetical protein [Bradyrhizobium sp. BR 10261]
MSGISTFGAVTCLLKRNSSPYVRLIANLLWRNNSFHCHVLGGDESLKDSSVRDGFLKLLLDYSGWVQLIVTKENGANCVWLNFRDAAAGWDVIEDHSEELSFLITPIIEQYQPDYSNER